MPWLTRPLLFVTFMIDLPNKTYDTERLIGRYMFVFAFNPITQFTHNYNRL